jgi:hypothetical protein
MHPAGSLREDTIRKGSRRMIRPLVNHTLAVMVHRIHKRLGGRIHADAGPSCVLAPIFALIRESQP